MESCSWKAEDIFFLRSRSADSKRETVYYRHRPYIRRDFGNLPLEGQQGRGKGRFDRLIYPVWISLARVLLEVQVGRRVLPNVTEHSELRRLLRKAASIELKDSKDSAYRGAIDACLNFGFQLGPIPESEQRQMAQKLVQNNIVSRLQESYNSEKLFCPLLEGREHFTIDDERDLEPQSTASTVAVPFTAESPVRMTYSPSALRPREAYARQFGSHPLPGVSYSDPV